MLNDEQVEGLRIKYGKVAVVDYRDHQLVFRRPSRDNMRDYRRKQDSPSERADALDQLAQLTIVAFDDETDGVRCRTAFLAFLDEFPAFTSHPKPMAAIAALSGLVEQEDEATLGKGVSIRSSAPKRTPTDSPNGFPFARVGDTVTGDLTGPASLMVGVLPQNSPPKH